MSALDDLLRSSGLAGRRAEPPSNGVRRVFLHAGQVFVAAEATEITTILGSCVAVCIWDAASGFGGMNHFMLPQDIGAHYATPRYARYATTALLDQLRAAGVDPRQLRAKVFGGACILTGGGASGRDLGTMNVRAARERLHAERIPIVDEDTGGALGRKLVFQSATGEASVTRVNRVIP